MYPGTRGLYPYQSVRIMNHRPGGGQRISWLTAVKTPVLLLSVDTQPQLPCRPDDGGMVTDSSTVGAPPGDSAGQEEE